MKRQHTKMDLLVLAVVLALLVSTFIKDRMLRQLPEVSSFTYQMELTDVEGDIAPGDPVLCMAGKRPVGIVTEISTDGEKLVLTLAAEGFPIDGGWHSNVYDIEPGFENEFYTETASWYGIVTGLS